MRERSLVEVIEKNNELFTESKALDNDQQTLVYENYSKFMAASDTLSELHTQMSALDADLADLKESISTVNTNYSTLEDSMAMKWKQIEDLKVSCSSINPADITLFSPNLMRRAMLYLRGFASRRELSMTWKS